MAQYDSSTDKLVTLNILKKYDEKIKDYIDENDDAGHDMLDTIDEVKNITDSTDEHVVSAYTIKNWSNRYTNQIIRTVTANSNSIQIIDNLFKDSDVSFEFFFEPNGTDDFGVALSKYTLDTDTGEMNLTFVKAPTVDTRIRIDVTTYR